MLDRKSVLDDILLPGQYGKVAQTSLILSERAHLKLHQICAWSSTHAQVLRSLCESAGASSLPGPGQAALGTHGSVLAVQPLRWWLLDATPPILDSSTAEILDLSCARTCLRIEGPEAAVLLNRHVPLDLRQQHCPENTVLSTGFHHVGVTIWHHSSGFDVFLPSSFAASLVKLLFISAEQFGFEVKQSWS